MKHFHENELLILHITNFLSLAQAWNVKHHI